MADGLKFTPRLFGLGAPLSVVLVASAMILGVGALQVVRSYQNAMAVARGSVEARAKSIAKLTDLSIWAVDLVASSVAEDLTAGLATLTASEMLNRRLRMVNQISDLIISDAGKRSQGHADTAEPMIAGIENASMAWHQAHPLDQEAHLELVFDAGTPRRTVALVSKAIRGQQGAVTGIVAAVLKPGFFDALYDNMIVGAQGAVALWRDDGYLVLRYPPPRQSTDQASSTTILIRGVNSPGRDSYIRTRIGIDGKKRLIGYRRLEHFPTLIIATSYAMDDVVGPWLQSEIAQLAAVIVCVGVLLGMGILTAIHRRRQAAAARSRRLDEALFRGVFDNATDQLFVYRLTKDGNFIIEAINPVAVRTTGLSRAELIGRRAVDVLPPRVASRAVADLTATIAAADVVRFQSEGLLNGKNIFNEVVQVPLANADGVFDRVFVGARDVTHFKDADARLRELNGRLLLAEQMAHVGHWRLEMPSQYTVWSDEVFRIYGLDPSSPVLGLDAAIAAYHPDDRDELVRLIEGAISSKSGFEFSLRLLRPDGDIRHVASRGLVEVAANGEISALFGTLMDITHLTMAEKLLEKQTALLQTTLAHMEQGLVMVDATDTIVVQNDRAVALLGHDLKTALTQALSAGDPGGGSAGCRLEVDGRVLDVRSVPVPGGGVVLTFTDVTGRERTEKRLRDSEARFRLLAENTSELIQLGHDDGRRSYVSPAIERLLGFTVAEFSAMRLRSYVHPDDIEDLFATTRRLGAGETEVSTVYRAVHKSKGWVWVEGVFRRIEGARGDEPTIVGTFRDVSERRHQAEALRLAKEVAEEARGEAERASAAKTEFLASMSHEIRTPLTGVLGYTELLLDDVHLTDDQRRNVERIQNAGTALLTVVNDILDFSKIEAGQVDLEPGPFRLEALMDATISIVRGAADQKRLALSVTIGPDLPGDLVGDQDRLRQVLLNLLNNAIKFTPAGGIAADVSLEGWTADGARIRFSVKDTGIGIPIEKRRHLFERFSQVDGSIARRFGGTGLGLAISRSLVTLMGGTIAVESTEGSGSTFWFSVPLAEARVPLVVPAASTPIVPISGGGVSVLLVDDLEINRDLGLAMLASAGHSVDLACDGAEAIAAVQAKRYDLVLMDVQMPGMDGFTATSHIRSLPGAIGRVPIVAMTANVLPDQIAQCRRAGMDDHLGKPVKKAALNALVERYRSQDRPPVAPVRVAERESAPVLNMDVLDEMRELLGADALRKMLDRLLDHLQRESVFTSSREPALLATAAHKVVSMAGSLGFTALAARCADLERACLDRRPLESVLVAVREARQAAIEQIDACMRTV